METLSGRGEPFDGAHGEACRTMTGTPFDGLRVTGFNETCPSISYAKLNMRVLSPVSSFSSGQRARGGCSFGPVLAARILARMNPYFSRQDRKGREGKQETCLAMGTTGQRKFPECLASLARELQRLG
jgi:hypothetical protein